MAHCGQACPYNTLEGCKVKEYNAICPLTNMATPITEHRMTNADRIRSMSDEELSCFLAIVEDRKAGKTIFDDTSDFWLEWLKQPAEEEK